MITQVLKSNSVVIVKLLGVIILILLFASNLQAQDAKSSDKMVESFNLWNGETLPKSSEIPLLKGVEFYVIKPYDYMNDSYRFLHGVALAWHKEKLYCSFGQNKGGENTAGEEARGRISTDGGKTWGEMFTIESGTNDLGVSHGVFLSHGDNLWAFHGAYYDDFQRTHTHVYLLNEETGNWVSKGIILDKGFWPMQEPQKMDDGNWIMGGIRVATGFEFDGNLPAVAISHGDDFSKWDLIVIPTQQAIGNVWGESSVYFDGSKVINVSRWGEKAKALVAWSDNYGRTWTVSCPSNLPMVTSKPYTGTLSTGQHYLIGTTTADFEGRAPLTIAVTRPGELYFSKVFIIRNAEFPDGPGESHSKVKLSYPYAIEIQGNLYVGYSNSGGGIGRIGEGRELWNNNSAELAIIPIDLLIEK
jgi:hypothetical protein